VIHTRAAHILFSMQTMETMETMETNRIIECNWAGTCTAVLQNDDGLQWHSYVAAFVYSGFRVEPSSSGRETERAKWHVDDSHLPSNMPHAHVHPSHRAAQYRRDASV
jgi:hypothetical protein